MVNKPMTVNFVPDGKTKGMSVISHTVDASETAKGKKGDKGAAKDKKGAAAAGEGAGPDGKLSKKDLKKLEKKAKKADAKAGGAPAAGGHNEKGKKEKKP